MDRIQTSAVWVVAVSLAFIAVFTTLDYFDSDTNQTEAEEAHRAAEIVHWQEMRAWECVGAV